MQEKGKNIQKVARRLIRYFRSQERIASESEMDELWIRIKEEVQRKTTITYRNRTLIVVAVAASFIGVVWIGQHYEQHFSENIDIGKIASTLNDDFSSVKEIILAVPGKEQIQVDNNSQVSYDKNGSIKVNSETVDEVEQIEKQTEEQAFDQLIVPKGRRSQLILADGSKLWVNAGTRVVYPRHFTQDTREIFVEGEVYVEATHDASHPFIVKTNNFDVQVLGTNFNVCAYKDTEKSEVVLAKGSVMIKDFQNKHVQLNPNQLTEITRSGIGGIKNVVASDYTCWIDGLLILHAEPIISVFKKLYLYYGIDIQFDESLNDVFLSGKLDLKERLDDVIRLIADTAPIIYTKQGNTFQVKKK